MQREEKRDEQEISRRKAFAWLGSALAGGAFACVETASAACTGACAECSCVGLIGAGGWPQVCQRCGHSWSVHT
jgi:hypothetical protein